MRRGVLLLGVLVVVFPASANWPLSRWRRKAGISRPRGLSAVEIGGGGGGVSVVSSGKNVTQSKKKRKKRRILILMSDTGGGHRASAQALAQALDRLFPGEFEVDIYDIWTSAGRWPLNRVVDCYSYLGRRPWLWRGLWYGTAVWSTRIPIRKWQDLQHRWRFKQALLERGDVDCVVSVHPLCQHVPLSSLALLREEKQEVIPFATVVTDLGSAHPMWFDARADRVFVPNKRVARLATFHGVPKKKVIEHGLPLRSNFVGDPRQPGTGSAFLHADQHDRESIILTSKNIIEKHMMKQKKYKSKNNNKNTTPPPETTSNFNPLQKAATLAGLLGFPSVIPSAAFQRQKRLEALVKQRRQPRVLIVGGGDGFGGLRNIVLATAEALKKRNKPANLVVVCGRNAVLRNQLETLFQSDQWQPHQPTVSILGFVSDMHMHMARADVLLTKAGPGTIAEAAALGLPVILTNYLPGQERGNVKFVTSDFRFGQLARRPHRAASLVVHWFDHPNLLVEMSDRAFDAAKPGSTNRIATDIAALARDHVR